MSSLSEIYNSTKSAFYERLSHPILGSFIIFWLVFNWEAVLFVIFGNEDMLYKFKWVNENHTDILQNFAYPLACSLAATLILPFLSLYLRLFTNKIHLWGLYIDINFKRAVEALNKSSSVNDFETVSIELNRTEQALDLAKTQFESELSSLKSRFNMFTPLMLEIDIPQALLDKHLNSKEQCKLNILVELSKVPNKSLRIEEFLQKDIKLNSELLTEIMKEFSFHAIVHSDTDDYGYPGTKVELSDDGVLEILNLKAKVISQEMNLGRNSPLPKLI
ncbi:hypothetical protein [Pseudoalteromonas prydzensis]|uniref:hypothetical protein n=1 Tax=Pseudoalteromonas prydzensis TaxID=182141 RepID=UPI0007E4F785|nr:hypothetical protein [Pseudoalteromonas prydzensis]MBE0378486.1 hypothetical protein [Pseudoalteromonas prydzensis ACAM 620]